MANLQQGPVFLTVETHLEKDTFILTEFSAREKISDVFECDLTMVSERNDISLEDITGKEILVKIEIDDETISANPQKESQGLVDRIRGGVGRLLTDKGTSDVQTATDRWTGNVSFGFLSSMKGAMGGLSKSLGAGLNSVMGGGGSSSIGDKITSLASNASKSMSANSASEKPSGFGQNMLAKLTSRLGGDSEQTMPGKLINKLGGALSGRLGGQGNGAMNSMTGGQQGGGFGNTLGGDSGGIGSGSGGITGSILSKVAGKMGVDANNDPIGGILSGLSGKLIDKARGNAFLDGVMDRLGGADALKEKAQGIIDKLDTGAMESGLKRIIDGDEENEGLLDRGKQYLSALISGEKPRPGLGWLTGNAGSGMKGSAHGIPFEKAREKGPVERRPLYGESGGAKNSMDRDLSRQIRYFHGVVGEIRQGATDQGQQSNLTVYTAKVFPKFWMLKFSGNCRIFQNKTVLEIVTSILDENDVMDVQNKTQSAGQGVREYCVQYNESNFDFINRLLEEEGIYYYFIHTETNHTMVLADAPAAHHQCPHTRTAQLETKRVSSKLMNSIQRCDLYHRVVPNEHAFTDYDFELPRNNLFTSATGQGIGGRIYSYPGKYLNKSDGQDITTKTIESEEIPRDMLCGRSTIPFFEPGGYFNLAGHPRSDANKQYVVLELRHRAKLGLNEDEESLYSNEFSSFNYSGVPYRPPIKTPKPRISGTQTAVVTGKDGEEIWTDQHGRVKVKFHWDENEATDETTSCWVRVSQGWAGNNWGMLFTPRIGHEVVITFLEGDPDRPLITGSVYNGDKVAPYLPDHPTISAIKSKSSKDSNGYNEIRFEDLTDQEQIYIHAQKDMDVDVEDNLSQIIHKGDESKIIRTGSRRVTLLGEEQEGANEPSGDDFLSLEKGHRTVVLKSGGDGPANHLTQLNDGDHSVRVVKGNHNVVLESGDQTRKLLNGSEITQISDDVQQTVGNNYLLQIKGDLEIDVTGRIKMKGKSFLLDTEEESCISAGTMVNIDGTEGIELNTEASIESNAGADIKSEAGASLNMEAGSSASYKASATTTIKSAMVKIN